LARYTFTLCRASGEPVADAIEATSRELSFRRNGIHTATVGVPLGSRFAGLVEPGLSRIKVWRERSAAELALDPGLDSVLEFYGPLPTEGFTVDPAGDTLTVVFSDPRWVLARRYALGTESFAGTDQGSILWGLVNTQNARSGGDTWIRQGGVTTSILRDRVYDRQVVWQLFDDMTNLLDGCDVDIDPRDDYPTSRIMGDLRVYAQQGSDLPAVHFAYGNGLLANCQNIKVTYAPVTTYASLVGAAGPTSGTQLSAAYGTPTEAGFGLLEDFTSDPDVSVQATLDAKAVGTVLEKQGLRPILTIEEPTTEAPRALEAYYLGDTVRASVTKGSFALFDQRVRVDGIDISISQEGYESVRLTLAGDV
jgi:hypothetical protein